ncbi:MAG TPA: DUF1054 family protein [Limnochordia bacterium]|nr:DUF1054 family protein [Limnochordia bacterium]
MSYAESTVYLDASPGDAEIRTQLAALGRQLRPVVGNQWRWPLHARLSAHTRRRAQPGGPPSLVLSPAQRGYQYWPFFTVAPSNDGLFLGLALREEAAAAKAALGSALMRRGAQWLLALRAAPYVWEGFGAHSARVAVQDIGFEDLLALADRLRDVKSAVLRVGLEVPFHLNAPLSMGPLAKRLHDDAGADDGRLLAVSAQVAADLAPLFEAAWVGGERTITSHV